MKENKWKKLKKHNDLEQDKLQDENQSYIGKVVKILCVKNMSLLEIEIIRRDLIGMATEIQLVGESIENRLGKPTEFARNICNENKEMKRSEQIYLSMQQFGEIAIIMTLGFGYLAGMFFSSVPVSLILWIFLTTAIAIVYKWAVGNRFVFEKGAKKWGENIGYGTVVVLLVLLYWFLMKPYSAYMISGKILCGILLLGMGIYIIGKILFINYVEKTAEEYHRELDIK